MKQANHRVAQRDLKYYIFDWDDNILHMPTMIHLERLTEEGQWVPCSVSTAMFSVIRTNSRQYRPRDGDWDVACCDFRDTESGDENIFLRDTREAIDRVVRGETRAAPSFLRFKRTLIEGRLFAIVTARGHEPDVIRAGVEYFIERVISDEEQEEMLCNLRGYQECFDPEHVCQTHKEAIDYFLNLNHYHAIRSSSFRALMERQGNKVEGTEDGKRFAIREFVDHVIHIARERGLTGPISIGFSDDDVTTATAVEHFLRTELGPAYPSVKFVIYYTSDPDHPTGRKVEVQGQMKLPF